MPDQPTKTKPAWRWFFSLVKPWAPRLSVAAVSLALSGSVSLLVPAAAGRAVDAALVEKSLGNLRLVVFGLIGLFAVSAVLDYLENWLIQGAAASILRDLRARLHAHLLTLPPAFYDTRRTGELLSRLNSDTGTLGSVLTRDLVSGLQRSLVLVGCLAILFTVHLRLTGVMLAAIPPIVFAAVLFARRIERISEREQDALAEANVAAEESLSGIRTVQAFGREPEERERYMKRLAALFALEMKSTMGWGIFHSLVSFIGFSAFALVLWYGASLVVQQRLTAGQLTSFLLYTMTVAASVGSLTSLYGRLAAAGGATGRVREVLDTPAAIADAPDARALPRPAGHVAFRDVRFSYPTTTRPALDGVSLEAAPGEMVALVGPSGGGKTTLVSLLLRFHDPQSGSVTVDGHDTRSLRLADLRAALGFVPQDIFLFGGTVAENIRYGRPGAIDAEVRGAAEAAQAAAFIERLPQKYDTLVGERGVRLSTGERQRIAIARVMLRNPAIVILDEATSSLDAESEHLVQKAFDRLFEGRTTLVIAHRLATVRKATRVAVLEKGKVAEHGTHAELLDKGGLYRRLCELQMLAEGKSEEGEAKA
ncbi:MAG: ATP-binding cassette domain-containing protein [Planctomycetes bacterium]|nr:ATP-binding cassette domain-containing protein [Planctomycetota bacterium]